MNRKPIDQMTDEEIDSDIEWLTRTDESCAMSFDHIKALGAEKRKRFAT